MTENTATIALPATELAAQRWPTAGWAGVWARHRGAAIRISVTAEYDGVAADIELTLAGTGDEALAVVRRHTSAAVPEGDLDAPVRWDPQVRITRLPATELWPQLRAELPPLAALRAGPRPGPREPLAVSAEVTEALAAAATDRERAAVLQRAAAQQPALSALLQPSARVTLAVSTDHAVALRCWLVAEDQLYAAHPDPGSGGLARVPAGDLARELLWLVAGAAGALAASAESAESTESTESAEEGRR